MAVTRSDGSSNRQSKRNPIGRWHPVLQFSVVNRLRDRLAATFGS